MFLDRMVGIMKAGNVWEWTQSPDLPYPYTFKHEAENPLRDRVLRGGSWNSGAGLARAAYRFHNGASEFNVDIGFRIGY